MKKKYKIILVIALINLTLFSINTNINVKAQTTTYSIAIHNNEEYIWEITLLDASTFTRVLGYEPNYQVGDRIRVIIDTVEDHDYFWFVSAYFWDYGADWSQQGTFKQMAVRKTAYEYNDSIFLPVPIADYLAAVQTYFEPEYTADGNKLSTIQRAQTDRDYLHERIYNDKGVLITEILYEYPILRPFIKVEATFGTIPMGIYFIGFMIVAIASIAVVISKRKKLSINNF
ncbi:MAG: hypothetical protein ACFFBH_13920 [Promethearchaeota archaeon]